MNLYKNLNGESGIDAYEYEARSITVRFSDGGTYLYTYESSGECAIEIMKELADLGIGLATYINQNVRDKYEEKLG